MHHDLSMNSLTFVRNAASGRSSKADDKRARLIRIFVTMVQHRSRCDRTNYSVERFHVHTVGRKSMSLLCASSFFM